MVRSPRRLFGMDVLGGERLAQDLLQVNELFVCLFVNPHPPIDSILIIAERN